MIWSILMAVVGWFLNNFFKVQKDKAVEKKYVQARKIEIETKAENVMLKKREEQRIEQEKAKAEYENANDNEKQNIIMRYFNKRR